MYVFIVSQFGGGVQDQCVSKVTLPVTSMGIFLDLGSSLAIFVLWIIATSAQPHPHMVVYLYASLLIVIF